jgi:hypothetical protein
VVIAAKEELSRTASNRCRERSRSLIEDIARLPRTERQLQALASGNSLAGAASR